MVRRVLTASLCGVAALLAPGRAVVTAVPRRRPVLKPGGKEEARAPPRRLAFGDCPATCQGYTCDAIPEIFGAVFTCTALETQHGPRNHFRTPPGPGPSP